MRDAVFVVVPVVGVVVVAHVKLCCKEALRDCRRGDKGVSGGAGIVGVPLGLFPLVVVVTLSRRATRRLKAGDATIGGVGNFSLDFLLGDDAVDAAKSGGDAKNAKSSWADAHCSCSLGCDGFALSL